MGVVLTHKGKPITDDDLAAIRGLMGERATWSRRSLSIALCERQGWVQENGAPRDAACRALLLALHRAGHIALPAPKWACREPWRRLRPARVEVDTTPIEGTLRGLGPIEIRQVLRTPDEATVNGLLEEHHYLRYTTPALRAAEVPHRRAGPASRVLRVVARYHVTSGLVIGTSAGPLRRAR